jgi:hypothetical protein
MSGFGLEDAVRILNYLSYIYSLADVLGISYETDWPVCPMYFLSQSGQVSW